MKTSLSLILFFLLIFLGYRVYTKTYDPCEVPIYYKIGLIDPKFGLSEKDVLTDTNTAVEILNSAYGKNDLFSHSEDLGVLTVNFIYDERSALNENINEQLNRVDQQSASIQEKIDEYETDVKDFDRRLNEFNSTVQKYNSQGGAPLEVYDDLLNKQIKLRAEGDELNRRADQLNLDSKNYNLQVGNLNQDVSEFNLALSKKPEEGIYDPKENSITVYFVDNKPELIHTIAHEFGHALGMNHVTDPDALMYPMSSIILQLNEADKSELKEICQVIPVYVYWRDYLLYKAGKQGIFSVNPSFFFN